MKVIFFIIKLVVTSYNGQQKNVGISRYKETLNHESQKNHIESSKLEDELDSLTKDHLDFLNFKTSDDYNFSENKAFSGSSTSLPPNSNFYLPKNKISTLNCFAEINKTFDESSAISLKDPQLNISSIADLNPFCLNINDMSSNDDKDNLFSLLEKDQDEIHQICSYYEEIPLLNKLGCQSNEQESDFSKNQSIKKFSELKSEFIAEKFNLPILSSAEVFDNQETKTIDSETCNKRFCNDKGYSAEPKKRKNTSESFYYGTNVDFDNNIKDLKIINDQFLMTSNNLRYFPCIEMQNIHCENKKATETQQSCTDETENFCFALLNNFEIKFEINGKLKKIAKKNRKNKTRTGCFNVSSCNKEIFKKNRKVESNNTDTIMEESSQGSSILSGELYHKPRYNIQNETKEESTILKDDNSNKNPNLEEIKINCSDSQKISSKILNLSFNTNKKSYLFEDVELNVSSQISAKENSHIADSCIKNDLNITSLKNSEKLNHPKNIFISNQQSNIHNTDDHENISTSNKSCPQYLNLYNILIDADKFNEKNDLTPSVMNLINPILENEEKFLTTNAFLEKISFLKNLIVVKFLERSLEEKKSPFQYFFLAKNTLPDDIKLKAEQIFIEHKSVKFFSNCKRINYKKRKNRFIFHYFLCYETLDKEWFFPNEKCEEYNICEFTNENANKIFFQNQKSNTVVKILEVLMNFYFANTFNFQTFCTNKPISSQTSLKNSNYIQEIRNTDQIPNSSVKKISGHKDVFCKEKLLSEYFTITDDIEVCKIFHIENTVFFVFTRTKTKLNHVNDFFNKYIIKPDFLFKLHEKSCHIYIKCLKNNFFAYDKVLTMIELQNEFKHLHNSAHPHVPSDYHKQKFKHEHIVYWKNFLLNYCTKNKLFLFLMNGIEKFICEKNFDFDEEIYKKISAKEENFKCKNQTYLCKCLLICFFLINEQKYFKQICSDMSKQKFNLYRNQSKFLYLFIDVFGDFFKPAINEKLCTWAQLEKSTIDIIIRLKRNNGKIVEQKCIINCKNTGIKITADYFMINFCSLRAYLMPDKYELSLLLIDILMFFTNKIYFDYEIKINFHKKHQLSSTHILLTFIRNSLTLNLLNYCIQEKYFNTVEYIVDYIKSFGYLLCDKNEPTYLMKSSQIKNFILDSIDLNGEFTALSAIFISMQNERLKYCSQVE
ncbi:hypothetical protein EDEG_01858 [Edhazardia aedis USNM 41457]|uniref:Uncharacterized protein n=1 Tax=Edhazardia aedis (strain USNM 41457) TaxID=1003232 RepID=J9D8L2_EDHAE|nr:hypothetical protein EDEG_01858 [Edhazardia aedis USNM 41457]|eukprot:EJW03859.1 hypothetical protein EDEG_01858 [Edhazardia aedis USNM 41457]